MSRKQNKKSDRPIKLITLDTETRGLFGEVFRVGVFDGERYTAGNTFKEVNHVILHYSIDYDVHVYIHNLDFDISKLAAELVPQVNFDDCIFINNNVAVFSTSVNNAMFEEEDHLKACPVVLHDSLKILPGSLAALCESFGLKDDEKKVSLTDHIIERGWAKYDSAGDYDKFMSEGFYFENVEPDEDHLNHYLEFDCRSLYKLIEITHQISGLELEDFVSCPTVASLAMKVYQRLFKKDYKTAISTLYRGELGEATEQFVRQAYYGGRTEVFIPSLDHGYHYDVNSLYPYVMKTFEFPVGDFELYHHGDAAKMFHFWMNYSNGPVAPGAGFLKCDIHIPDTLHIPPLPKRHGGKLLFPVGNIQGVWTLPEIKMALEYGCKIKKIYSLAFWQKTAPIFRDFVSTFEQIKITSKGAKKQFAKLMQNSLYGKFGMKRERRTLLPIAAKAEIEKEGKLFIELKHPLINESFIETEIISRAPYIQPHIAAYVTSYARMVLYHALTEETTGEKYYCDTDSVVSGGAFPSDMVDPLEYGKWDLESTLEKGIYIQPKLYYERRTDGSEVIRGKGIPKAKLKDFTQANFDHIVNQIKTGAERVEIFEGYKVRKKFVTMLKSGETFDTAQVIRKGINLRAKQKRIMDFNNNTTKPHKIMEFM